MAVGGAALLLTGTALLLGATAPGSSRVHPKPAVRIDGAQDIAVALQDGERGVVTPAGQLVLDVRVPRAGVTPEWLSAYVPSRARREDLRKAHGGWPPAGAALRLPLSDLGDEARVRLLRGLFQGSGPRDGDWVHPVGSGPVPAALETWENLALWYTGSEKHAAALRDRNAEAHGQPASGRSVAIPSTLLLPGFARVLAADGAAHSGEDAAPRVASVAAADPPAAPDTDATTSAHDAQAPPEPEDDFTETPASPETGTAPPATSPAPAPPPQPPLVHPPVAEGAEQLRYGKDAQGRYAIYRLRKGEALYSAVVVRFTGRVDVQEVNETAARIAARSGIRNVTAIPVGYKVKIPIDDLLVEYQPRDDARRQEWERHQAEVEQYTNQAVSRNLSGVAVILDAGHGGRDRGAAHNGVWEHDYVYDILCRVKALLETTTRARVIPTIRDRKEGYRIHESEHLVRNQAEVLLTDPLFPLSGTVPSVNLRWYLSNSWYRRLVKEGTDPSKVVFTSLHADARHPSLAGAMVYVPGAEYRSGRFGSRREVYARYREAREVPYVSFTGPELQRSEGLSREFAATLVGAFQDGGVGVEGYQPVRERIIRRGRAWVPAVLRCNLVPVEVLVEVSNLMNPRDSRSLAEPAYRQKIAAAYVEALRRYFGPPSPAAAGDIRGR
jgi:N-acetylmuramoyl-L-alanine amidase